MESQNKISFHNPTNNGSCSTSIKNSNKQENGFINGSGFKESKIDDKLITSSSSSSSSNDVFRYSPNSKESKDQLNMNSAQLTPPYQQSTSLFNNNNKLTNENILAPLSELKIEKLEELKVQDLKFYLKNVNLQVSGPKITLVERLKGFILKSKTSNLHNVQLTPPNTPTLNDSDSDDKMNGKNCTTQLNSNTNIFVNNNSNSISHFPTASIPLNGYAIQSNQFQFQQSSNQLNSTKMNTANGSFTLASIQQPHQIFLSGQQLNASLTVHQQLTTIAPTLVASQFTPILVYSRSTTNPPIINSFNQPTTPIDQQPILNGNNNDSPTKSSIKSSIRKNILMKQKKQEELRQQQLEQQNIKHESKKTNFMSLNNKTPSQPEVYYSNLKNETNHDEQNLMQNFAQINDSMNANLNNMNNEMMNLEQKEKNDFEMDSFELLMEVEEVADFMNANKEEDETKDQQMKEVKTNFLNQLKKPKEIYSLNNNKSNQLNEINQIDRIDQLNRINETDQLNQLETERVKNNLEFNDYSNMDSILNDYEINDLTFNDLNDNSNMNDWLNGDQLDVNNINDSNMNHTNLMNNSSTTITKHQQDNRSIDFLKNDLNHAFKTNLLNDVITELKDEYSTDLLNSTKQLNSYELTNCNLMNSFFSNDQNLTNCFEDNDLGFRSTTNYATEFEDAAY